MIAIVTDFGDFDVALTFAEFDNWDENSPLIGELLEEGDIPCGKKIRLVLEPNADRLIAYRLDGGDWKRADTVELICNEDLYDQLDGSGSGKIYCEFYSINILLRLSDVLGAPKTGQLNKREV